MLPAFAALIQGFHTVRFSPIRPGSCRAVPDRARWCRRVPRVVPGRLMSDRARLSRPEPHGVIKSGLRAPRTGRAVSSPANTFRHEATLGGTARQRPGPSGTIRHGPYPAGRSGICCGLLPACRGCADSKRHHPDHTGSRWHPATPGGTHRHPLARHRIAVRHLTARRSPAQPPRSSASGRPTAKLPNGAAASARMRNAYPLL
jgi:hypothetical protein